MIDTLVVIKRLVRQCVQSLLVIPLGEIGNAREG